MVIRAVVLFIVLLSAAGAAADVQIRRVAQELTAGETKLRDAVIAILPFDHLSDSESTLGHQLSEDLTVELLRTKAFKISERSQVTLALNQLALHQTGLISAEEAKKLGKAIGAKGLVIGTISEQSEGYVKLNIRLVDIETFAVQSASSLTFNPQEQVNTAIKAENYLNLNSIDIFAGYWSFTSEVSVKNTSTDYYSGSYSGSTTATTVESKTSRYANKSKLVFGLRYQYAFGHLALALTGEYSAAGILGAFGGLFLRLPLYNFSPLPVGTHIYLGLSVGYADTIVYKPTLGFNYAPVVDTGIFVELQLASATFNDRDYEQTLSGPVILAGVRYHP